jgi:trigger factor
MAVTRQNIGLLNDKLTVHLAKNDYAPTFEKSLKEQAKKASIPGFRKGMVPASLVKKMYGQGLLTDEILRSVDKQLNDYLQQEKLEIFAQPLPLNFDLSGIDANNPADYTFEFEVGLKPDVNIQLGGFNGVRYQVAVTDEMVNEELERQRERLGKATEYDTVSSEDNMLTVTLAEGEKSKNTSFAVKYFKPSFREQLMGKKKEEVLNFTLSEAFEGNELEFVLGELGYDKHDTAAADKSVQMTITKIGLTEKAEIDENLYNAIFPNRDITSREALWEELKKEIESAYAAQARNQLHDQLYHYLIDHTHIEFPEAFLKRWLQKGGEKQKTEEEAEQEYPTFSNQLKWSLITGELINKYQIEVKPEEIKEFAARQIMSYMGVASLDDAPWLEDYSNRMMKDQKFVENTYYQLQTTKLFEQLETEITPVEETISVKDFESKLHHHHH